MFTNCSQILYIFFLYSLSSPVTFFFGGGEGAKCVSTTCTGCPQLRNEHSIMLCGHQSQIYWSNLQYILRFLVVAFSKYLRSFVKCFLIRRRMSTVSVSVKDLYFWLRNIFLSPFTRLLMTPLSTSMNINVVVLSSLPSFLLLFPFLPLYPFLILISCSPHRPPSLSFPRYTCKVSHFIKPRPDSSVKKNYNYVSE